MEHKQIIRDDVLFPASKIAHWPGQSIGCCDEHADKIVAIGKAMGYGITFTDAPEEAVCINCVNEKGGKQ